MPLLYVSVPGTYLAEFLVYQGELVFFIDISFSVNTSVLAWMNTVMFRYQLPRRLSRFMTADALTILSTPVITRKERPVSSPHLHTSRRLVTPQSILKVAGPYCGQALAK